MLCAKKIGISDCCL